MARPNTLPSRKEYQRDYKREHYTIALARMHAPGQVNKALVVALQLITKYGKRQRTVQQLRADFGMSRASAYRWRAAWIYIQGAVLTNSLTTEGSADVAVPE